MKNFILFLIAGTFLFSSCKQSNEKLIKTEFKKYIQNNFDDPKSVKEIVSIEITDTISVEKIRFIMDMNLKVFHLTDSLNKLRDELNLNSIENILKTAKRGDLSTQLLVTYYCTQAIDLLNDRFKIINERAILESEINNFLDSLKQETPKYKYIIKYRRNFGDDLLLCKDVCYIDSLTKQIYFNIEEKELSEQISDMLKYTNESRRYLEKVENNRNEYYDICGKIENLSIPFVTYSNNENEKGNKTTSEWVLINGIKWAKCNVDKPGTFAKKPEDAGMLYQWNSKIGWSTTNPMVNSDGGTTWNAAMPTGNSWKKTNNPCPPGWRLPTLAEQNKLVASGSFWDDLNGVQGRFFGKGENRVFFPAAGYRFSSDGAHCYKGNSGYYWSSTSDGSHSAYGLECLSNDADTYNFDYGRRFGYSVRCVSE